MKYAVVSTSNGTFSIDAEWNNNLQGARNSYWDRCKALNAAPDVIRAVVTLVNENWDVVEDKKEIIEHEVEPEE